MVQCPSGAPASLAVHRRAGQARHILIKAAADHGDQSLAFTEMEMGVICDIAYHQPIDRVSLADIFGKQIGHDGLAWLRYKGLIATAPRSSRPGAPYIFVTTETFLVTFDRQSLRDLLDMEPMESVEPPNLAT
jgi:chromosome segregation and condensation protein ScpB